MAEVYPAPEPEPAPKKKRSKLPQPEPAPKKKRSKLLMGCLGLLALTVVCGAISSLMNNGTNNTASESAVIANDPTLAPGVAETPADLAPNEELVPTQAVAEAAPTVLPPTPASDPAALLPEAPAVLSSASTPTTAAQAEAPTIAVPSGQVVSNANVRNIPSANGSTIVGQAATGDMVTIRGKVSDDSWYAVTLPGGLEGWISATLLTVEAGVVSAAPVLATPIPVAVVPTTAPAVAAPAPAAPVPAENSGLNTGGRDLYNCGDFATWAEANAVYQANLPGDPNKLDANDDGSPCDSLR